MLGSLAMQPSRWDPALSISNPISAHNCQQQPVLSLAPRYWAPTACMPEHHLVHHAMKAWIRAGASPPTPHPCIWAYHMQFAPDHAQPRHAPLPGFFFWPKGWTTPSISSRPPPAPAPHRALCGVPGRAGGGWRWRGLSTPWARKKTPEEEHVVVVHGLVQIACGMPRCRDGGLVGMLQP